MRIPRSIRWRLQLWYGALLVAILCGFGLTAFHFERVQQYRRADEGLQARVSALVDALRSGPDRGSERRREPELRLSASQEALFSPDSGYYFVIWMQGREPRFRSANAPRDIPRPDRIESPTRMRGEVRETFLFAAPVDCVLVGKSVAAERADLHRLAVVLLVLGAVVAVTGLLIGWWLVAIAIRPIEAISATAAKIATGDLSQRISVAETDSELGQLARVLNSTFARLEGSFSQQARFTADAAHELRTPVAAMLTQTQSALTRERPAAEYRETLEACERASQRMRRLIESLLELARLDAGQEAMRRTECDLAAIAGDCLEVVRPLAATRGITLNIDLGAAACTGDPDRLAQVALNLFINGIEHTRDSLEVISRLENGSVILTVSDNGPGVAPEDLPRIFERFYRASQSRTDGAQHNGLGLAISRAIAVAHGGTLEAGKSAQGGAEFTLRLPSGMPAHPGLAR